MRNTLLLLCMLCPGMEATADGIAGHWGGAKDQLESRGVHIEANYIGELARNLDPGLVRAQRTSIYHDNLDITLAIDGEKLGVWPGLTVFVHGLRNHGGDPSAQVIGDLQTASNIEAPDQFILYEAWLEQNLANDRLSLLFGLHDLNSEFYVGEYASLMLNSSSGIGPALTASVPASIFPKAGLGARIRWSPWDGTSMAMAVYDGDPNTRGFRAGEGEFYIIESAIDDERTGHIRIGYWMHSANPSFAGRTFTRNQGYYALLEREIMPWDGGALGMFVRYGASASDRNAVFAYFGAGLHARGIIPGRDDDELGLALARASVHATANGPVTAETTWELTYHLHLWHGLDLQPSFQRIAHPGGLPSASPIRVVLLRFEVDL